MVTNLTIVNVKSNRMKCYHDEDQSLDEELNPDDSGPELESSQSVAGGGDPSTSDVTTESSRYTRYEIVLVMLFPL